MIKFFKKRIFFVKFISEDPNSEKSQRSLMNKISSNLNAQETLQSRNIKFSFTSLKNLDQEGINDTGKFSFKNLPGTQYSLANTDAHYRSRLLIEGSFFRQVEQSGVKEVPIAKKRSIVEQMEGILEKKTYKTPQIIELPQNQGLLLSESHVIERRDANQ